MSKSDRNRNRLPVRAKRACSRTIHIFVKSILNGCVTVSVGLGNRLLRLPSAGCAHLPDGFPGPRVLCDRYERAMRRLGYSNRCPIFLVALIIAHCRTLPLPEIQNSVDWAGVIFLFCVG